MAKVSIIIPVYNAADYLPVCLKSVINQKEKDLQILLIDDGSTDLSGDICDEYSQRDNRIEVVHKSNKGVSHSRNVGIDMANGEWIMFVDADDVLTSDAFEIISPGLNGTFNMVIGGMELINEKGLVISRNGREDVVEWDMNTCLHDVYRAKFCSYNGYCANRLFRLKEIKDNHLRFREDIYYREDALFLIQYLLMCTGMAYYSLSPIYLYRQHAENATSIHRMTYNPKITTGMDSHLLSIKYIKTLSGDDILLKYAQKGLITSFRGNMTLLRKYHIMDFKYYFLIIRKLIKGVGLLRCLLLLIDDKLPVILHPLTSFYRKSNLRIAFIEKVLQNH